MQTAVIYKSKAGFTKQYAQWIAEELSADLFEASQIQASALAAYDTIIYGGGLYAVGINGVGLIKDHLQQLAGKKLVVFATGASPGRPEEIAGVVKNNFDAEQQERIRFFYLRGGFDASKLGLRDRLLMALLKRKLLAKQRRGSLSPDERGMLHAYNHPVSFVRRANIAPLLAYARSDEQ